MAEKTVEISTSVGTMTLTLPDPTAGPVSELLLGFAEMELRICDNCRRGNCSSVELERSDFLCWLRHMAAMASKLKNPESEHKEPEGA